MKILLFVVFLIAGNSWAHKFTPVCQKADTGVATSEVNSEFSDYVKIFNNPKPFLNPEVKFTPKQIEALAAKAKDFLLQYAKENPGNDVHIAEHLEALEKIRKSLKNAGGDFELARLIILIHDLGKEFKHLPKRYTDKMEEVFSDQNLIEVLTDKDPSKNREAEEANAKRFSFLGKHIMGHEFGSMFMIKDMVKDLELTPEQVNKLMALISRHNAGYKPTLEGNHFWVSPNTWGKFVKMMKEKGNIEFSPEYFKLMHVEDGGDINTVAVTAHDRALTLTLNSLKKIPQRLIDGNWNSGAFSQLFKEVSTETMKEVRDVLSNLYDHRTPRSALAARKALEADIIANHEPNAKKIIDITPHFKPWEKGPNGEPAIDIPKAEQEQKNAVFYRSKSGKIIKVTVDKVSSPPVGTLFERQSDGNWKPLEQGHPLNLLFDKYIFPENNYSPPQLK